jgi:hypothetical protein
MSDVQHRDETKLANGGGAFPFWVSVLIVVVFGLILFGIGYGILQIILAAAG